MNDIWTMIWKETKDSLLQGGWSAVIRPLLLIGILGIGFPWRLGLQWLALTPLVMGLVLYIPFIVISVSLAMPLRESGSDIRWKRCWPAASAIERSCWARSS